MVFESVPATISTLHRPTSAVVLQTHLNNQNLTFAKLVSIGDKLVQQV
jgi:hypothetical protein